MFLDPERVSTPDWKSFLKELKKIEPTIFTFDVDEVEVEIHQLTFGIKRAVVALLVGAYEISRRPPKHAEVTIQDIRSAYRSAKYTVHREDIEILFKQQIIGKSLRGDLWCPFYREQEPITKAAAIDANEKNQRNIEAEILHQFDSKEERAKSPRRVKNLPPSVGGNVIRLRGSKTLKQKLLDGADEFDKL